MAKDSILVRMDMNDDFVAIRTFDRDHGRRGRFFIGEQTIRTALAAERKVITERDIGSYADVWRDGSNLRIYFTWLSTGHRDEVYGFHQTIRIPEVRIRALLHSHVPQTLLSASPNDTARIDARQAGKTIRRILANPDVRRAFRKAMRDCFQWQDEVITLFCDGEYDFYFTTRSGCPKCGGLILHEGNRNGHPHVYYSVHT